MRMRDILGLIGFFCSDAVGNVLGPIFVARGIQTGGIATQLVRTMKDSSRPVLQPGR